MRIIFVRHGHPDYILDCLTELGHLQAEAAAQRLKDEPISAIYSSDKGRAIETAEHIAKAVGLPIKESFEFIREGSWGPLDPEDTLPHKGNPWMVCSDLVKEGRSMVRTDWQTTEPFRRSKMLEMEQRISAGMDSLLSEYGLDREGEYYRVREQNNSTIVMASHAGASGMALSHLFNIPFPLVIKSFSPNFTAITVVEFDGEQGDLTTPSFELLNDARHIEGISTDVFFGN